MEQLSGAGGSCRLVFGGKAQPDPVFFVMEEAKVQPELNSVTNAALIGLEYVVEIVDRLRPSAKLLYACGLCGLTLNPPSLMAHLVSARHRETYFAKWLPDSYEVLLKSGSERAKINEFARVLELRLGRSLVWVVTRETFVKDATQVVQYLHKRPHFIEKPWVHLAAVTAAGKSNEGVDFNYSASGIEKLIQEHQTAEDSKRIHLEIGSLEVAASRPLMMARKRPGLAYDEIDSDEDWGMSFAGNKRPTFGSTSGYPGDRDNYKGPEQASRFYGSRNRDNTWQQADIRQQQAQDRKANNRRACSHSRSPSPRRGRQDGLSPISRRRQASPLPVYVRQGSRSPVHGRRGSYSPGHGSSPSSSIHGRRASPLPLRRQRGSPSRACSPSGARSPRLGRVRSVARERSPSASQSRSKRSRSPTKSAHGRPVKPRDRLANQKAEEKERKKALAVYEKENERYLKFKKDYEERQAELLKKWESYEQETFQDHPCYSTEWSQWYRKKHIEVKAQGKDPKTYPYTDEWKTHWVNTRIQQIKDAEFNIVRLKALEAYGYKGMPDPPVPPVREVSPVSSESLSPEPITLSDGSDEDEPSPPKRLSHAIRRDKLKDDQPVRIASTTLAERLLRGNQITVPLVPENEDEGGEEPAAAAALKLTEKRVKPPSAKPAEVAGNSGVAKEPAAALPTARVAPSVATATNSAPVASQPVPPPTPAPEPVRAPAKKKTFAEKLVTAVTFVTCFRDDLPVYADKLQLVYDAAVEAEALQGEEGCLRVAWTAETRKYIMLSRARLLGRVETGFVPEERKQQALMAVQHMQDLLAEGKSVPLSTGGVSVPEPNAASPDVGGAGDGPGVILGVNVKEMAQKLLHVPKNEGAYIIMRVMQDNKVPLDEKAEEVKTLIDAIDKERMELEEKLKAPPQPGPSLPVAMVAPVSAPAPSRVPETAAVEPRPRRSPGSDAAAPRTPQEQWDSMGPTEFAAEFLVTFKFLPKPVQTKVVAYLKGVETHTKDRAAAIQAALDRLNKEENERKQRMTNVAAKPVSPGGGGGTQRATPPPVSQPVAVTVAAPPAPAAVRQVVDSELSANLDSVLFRSSGSGATKSTTAGSGVSFGALIKATTQAARQRVTRNPPPRDDW